jgi:hypothetical protein
MSRAYRQFLRVLVLLTAITSIAEVTAEPIFVSPAGTVALVELYTSEGCSSCPPADRLLRQLPGQVQNQQNIAPLAFHVDYWDYIGWQDPYADPMHADRQRYYARRWSSPSIYTPQFIVQGQQTPLRTHLLSRINKVNQVPAPVAIRATVASTDGNSIQLQIALEQVAGKPVPEDKAMFVALYENNLVSQVSQGENSGRLLTHDFVVRRLLGSFSSRSLASAAQTVEVALQQSWKRKDLGLVVFMQDLQQGRVIQALHITPEDLPL